MDVATNVRTLQNYVNGERVASGASEMLVVPDPATGEPLAQVPLSTAEDVHAAVRAAQEAYQT